MMKAALERRLAGVEAQLHQLARAASSPGGSEAFAWLSWVPNSELDWVEEQLHRVVHQCHEPTPLEQARWLAIEVGAIAKMLAGQPDEIEQARIEREGMR